MKQLTKGHLLLLMLLSLAGCGGGGSTSPTNSDETPVDETTPSDNDSFYSQDTSAGVEVSSGDFALSKLASANTANEDGSASLRQMKLTWENPFSDNSTVNYTICQYDENETSNCADLGTTTDTLTFSTHLSSLIDAASQSYFIIANNGTEELTSSVKTIHPGELGRMAGYFKASNPSASDAFGTAVAISGDGLTMAVASSAEDSEATGLNGDESDSDQDYGAFGAVYIFTSDGNGNWEQSNYVKASTANAKDYFGYSLALSEDGLTLAVGAYGEDSSSVTDQDDNEADYAGAVYIFTNDNSVWSQTAYLKADTPTAQDYFGYSVALTDDGSRLVVGAPYHSSDTITRSGKAVVFDYNTSDSTWSQSTELEADNADTDDRLGTDVTISGDGNTIAVASRLEDSATTGIATTGASDDDAKDSGAVYVYTLDASWSQTAYIKASNASKEDYFGRSIALNQDGKLLAVGATEEDSVAQGINGDSSDNSGKGAGAVYLFRYSGTSWSEEAYLKGSNTEGANAAYIPDSATDPTDDYWGDNFGLSVAFNSDGTVLAVGSSHEDSGAIGINWDESDNSSSNAGAAYLFAYDSTSTSWSQTDYIKASNTQEEDSFAVSLDLDSDGNALVVGAQSESSGASGINGEDTNRDDDEDNDVNYSGAVYLY